MNWRDVYEDKDSTGCEVIDVLMHEGRGVAFVYKSDSGINYVHYSGAQLIEKPKPKKYRPFTIDEFREFRKNAGGVVWLRDKTSEREYLVISVHGGIVTINNRSGTLDWMITNMTFLDGSPAGVLED